VFTHVFNDVLHGDIDGVFDNALVKVADDTLDNAELLEKFAPCIQYLVGENILFTIDP